MAGIVRKLVIVAAVDGLILSPVSPHRAQPSAAPVRIAYRHGAVSAHHPRPGDEGHDGATVESHGILGLLKIASSFFLLSITGRQEVARIWGSPVYVITEVAIIPLASLEEADSAIRRAQTRLEKYKGDPATGTAAGAVFEDSGATSQHQSDSTESDIESDEEAGPTTATHRRQSSIAQDVFERKGLYGRLTDRWFLRSGFGADRLGTVVKHDGDVSSKQPITQADVMGESVRKIALPDLSDHTRQQDQARSSEELDTPQSADSIASSLAAKILRTANLYFSSKSFYFSYNFDLSRRLSNKPQLRHGSDQLYRSFDPIFFWNAKIMAPFIESGQQAYVLPLIQGFVGQRAFTIGRSPGDENASLVTNTSSNVDSSTPSASNNSRNEEGTASPSGGKEFLLTLISRRSIRRAGLRYLRRGIDEEGNAANFVETEQLLSTPTWDAPHDKVYSLVGIRGSIPLFWTQTPYSFKPPPVLWGSQATNEAAFESHFACLSTQYGRVQAVSLVDKNGTESGLGKAFASSAASLAERHATDRTYPALSFEWFDFHRVCRGMRFDNVSALVGSLAHTTGSFGWTVQEDNRLTRRQSGVVRTNCMDCLDRTNVVQAFLGRHALEGQLRDQGYPIDLQHDPTTHWFNSVWADNGDNISRQYSGTAALKGDYTRTRRRNIRGALTDFGLTLSRYYNSIVNDSFAQAFIDYSLGQASEAIFAEFEAEMKAQDYAVDIHKVRQNAIDICADRVVEDDAETLQRSWTLSCPQQPHTLRTYPFEECVVLLTNAALYSCRFDWRTEKIHAFERVALGDLTHVRRGVYCISALSAFDLDEKRNVGIVISYRTGGSTGVRVNTRSVSSAGTAVVEHRPHVSAAGSEQFLAFKAIPPRSSFSRKPGENSRQMDERKALQELVDSILNAANKVGSTQKADGSAEAEKKSALTVEDGDIISVAEAKKNTGFLEQLGYSIKRFVWT